jgi:HSP20 family protein
MIGMTTNLTRWNPFKEMEELSNRLSSFWGLSPVRAAEREYMIEANWAPLVDIIENDDEYLIKADLPELSKKDIKVRVDNGILYISGERKCEKKEKERYHRTERFYGSFVRSFSLPDDANHEAVSANFKDGVLAVHVRKSEEAKPRQIEVKVS